jgi:DNA topoisomerase-1
VSLPRGTDPLKIDLDSCIKLIEDSLNKTTGGILVEYKDSDIQVIDGSYGPYIKHAGSNYKLPKGTDPATLSEERCKEIIASSEPTGRKKKRK